MQQTLDEGKSWSLGGVAALTGYALDIHEAAVEAGTALSTGEALTVTLVWRALQPSDAPLVAFVHLVSADGRLIAQPDGAPAAGARPTTGWVVGEYVADPHQLVWLDAAYQGEATLHVGLYDPMSGRRLKDPSGNDHLLLPVPLPVAP